MIYSFRNDNRFLSNFYPVEIECEGVKYPSVEHAYQRYKSDESWWIEFCSNPDTKPGETKKESKKIKVREDWNVVKLTIMEGLLRLKFEKEPFKTWLLNTGEQNLIEGNTWGDTFWGVDLTVNPNYGENHLGRLLMKIREELKNERLDF